MPLIPRLRTLLRRIFFWHERKRSSEFTPEPAHDHALVLQVTQPPSVPRFRQWRYVARILTLQERRLVLGMVLLFLAASGLAVWLTVRNGIVTVPAPGGRIVEAVIGAPKYPHPFYAATNDPDQDLVALVYAGLFRRTNGSDVVPDLAERFSWSEDGKKLTIVLRGDIRFHDGVPVTADDVVFTLSAAKDPAWRSPYITGLRDVTVERVDDLTIALSRDRQDATILDTLTLGILPAHIWQDVPPGSAHLADANVRPIGAGPFRVRSFTRDARGAILAYTLERNDQYHGIKPFLDQLELRFFSDRSQAEDALKNGLVDTLAFVPGPEIENLTKHERVHASTIELPQETVAFFNVNDPLLKELRIRQALTLAVDRADVVNAQADLASPINGPFPFATFEAPTSTIDERLEQARKLLDTAGWALLPGADLRTKKPSAPATTKPKTTAATSTTPAASSTPLTLTIAVPDVQDLVAVASVLARQWSLLGIRVELKVEDAATLARRILTDRNSQIVVWNILLSPSQDQRPVWWSGEATGRGLNLSNLGDRNVDDALDAIRAATTTEALAAARTVFSQAVLVRAPAVFLTRPGYGYIHSARLKGMSDRLQLGRPSDRFSDAVNWYVKTGWRWK